MKFAKTIAIAAAAAVSVTLYADNTFAKELKLKVSKTPTVSAALEDASGGKIPMRLYGKVWGPAQIAENGSLFRLKSDLKQYLFAKIQLQNKSFTFSAWAKADSIADPQSPVVVNTTRPPCWGVVLRNDPKNADSMIADVFYYWNVPGYPGALLRFKGTLKKTDWHFFTCVFDRENETFTFYVDGKVADKAIKMPKATPAFRENINIGGGNGLFNGSIRDVRFTPAVLTAEQVAALYKSTAPAEGK